MSKTGRAVAKLQLKSKGNAMKFRMGTHKPIIARTTTPFHEKAVAFAAHKRAIHGFERDGVVIDEGGRNPGPAECFRGDGLPDDSLAAVKPPKTMAERAKEDKRRALKDEMVEGWKPQRYLPRFARWISTK